VYGACVRVLVRICKGNGSSQPLRCGGKVCLWLLKVQLCTAHKVDPPPLGAACTLIMHLHSLCGCVRAQGASGFSAVMEAMRDSRRPAVGHNCLFDVMFVMAAFVDPRLPRHW